MQNATHSRVIWSVITFLFLVMSMSAQEKWSRVDQRSTKLSPSGQGVRSTQSVKEYNPPPGTPTLVRTPKGTFTVNPSFRVHPTTNSTQSETPITRHPHNPNIMYGSANAVDIATTFISEGLYLTTDGGTTWFGSDTTASSPITDHNGDPAPFIAPNGTIGISYLLGNGIGVSVSTNMGVTWAATTTLQGGDQDKNHSFVDDISTSPYYGRMYVTWSDFTATDPPTAVSYSTNNGSTWSTSVHAATPDASHYHQGVNGVVGVDGSAYIFFQNPIGVSPFTGDMIGMAKSTNGGASWTANNNIYNCNGARGTISSKGSIRINDFPSAAIDKSNGARHGWIYVVTAEKNLAPAGSDDDIILHRSTDGGATWSAGIRVNQDTPNNGKIQYMPWVCVDEAGGVNVVYYDDRLTSSDSAMVYVSRSLDGAATWVDIPITDSRFKPSSIPDLATGYQGDYIGITSGNGKIWPYWTSNKSGTYQAWATSITTTENFGFAKGLVTTGGNPLAGVAIDFSDASQQQNGTSDGAGAYAVGALVDTSIRYQQYTLRAQKFGYVTFTDTVTLIIHDTVSRNISMTPAAGGTLSVHTYNSSNTSIKANVRVKFNGTEVLNDYTDSLTGMYSTPLPVGTYDVVVDAPSPYGTKSYTGVLITENATTDIDALLRAVVEVTPEAMYDTLGVDQSNTMMLTLTNTTSDSIPYQISNEEAQFRNLPTLPQFDENSPSKDLNLTVNKNTVDPRFGPEEIYSKGGPDAAGYVWIDSDEPNGPAFSWVDISGVGTPITTWGTGTPDDGYSIMALPFTFPFYGNAYNQVKITTNGWVSFDVASTNSAPSNAAIPNAAEPNGAIFGLWDDLDSTAGRTFAYYDTANSRFIVQYQDVIHWGTTETGRYTFEIILYPNGNALVQYLDLQGTLNSSSVGIENATGTTGLQVVFNNTYLHNNLAVLYKTRGVDWLTHSPAFGVLAPNGSTSITNTFDATNLTPGTTYLANVYVDGTHPDISESIIVPASLRVQPLAGAGINVSPLTKAFGNVIINQTKTDSVRIRNVGTADLTISDVSSSNNEFTTSLLNNVIPAGDSTRLYITYSPLLPAHVATGSISIVSNDPLNTTVQVSVSGTGVGVPHFTSTTTLLEKFMEGGGQDSIQFNVDNVGTLDGTYKAVAVMYSAATNKKIEIPVSLRSTFAQAGRVLIVSDNPGIAAMSEKGKDLEPPKFELLGVSSSRIYTALSSAGYMVDTVSFASHDPATYTNYDLVVWSAGSNTATMFNDAAKRTALVNRVLAGGKVWVEGGEVGYVYRLPSPGTQIDATFRRIVLHDSTWVSDASTSSIVANPSNTTHAILTTPNVLTLPIALTVTGTGYGERDAMRTILGDPGVTKVTGWTSYPDTAGLLTWSNGTAPVTVFTSFSFGAITDTANATKLAQNIAAYLVGSGGGASGPWLGVKPGTGDIAMNASAQLTATFDATSPTIYNNPGDYYGRIAITATNSALAESLNIPAHMFIVPPSGARLAVQPDSLGFPGIEIGQSSSLSVLVRNIGGAALDVTDLIMSNGNFSATPTSFTLNSLDTQLVAITFTAPTPGGDQSGTMTFVSNDASAPVVKLGARSVGVPHILATPDSIYVSQASGPDTLSSNMTIQNTGTDTLRFSVNEASVAVARALPQNHEAYMLAKGEEDTHNSPAQIMASGGPDAFGYFWMDSDEPGGPAYNWVDISSTGTPLSWGSGNGDEGHTIMALPFSFPFYGLSYNQIKITSNGWVSFDVDSTNHTYSNVAIPTSAEPNNAVFGFWDDLDQTAGGDVLTYYDAANSQFIIQYNNVPRYSTGGPYTFEIILKSSGEILCQYNTMTDPINSSTIGIENATGTDGLQVVFNNTYLHNNMALRFTSDLYPWMSTNVNTGTLAPGESQIIQVLTHPGVQLPSGTYNGGVRIAGNTPDVSQVKVRMDVTGGTPYISLTHPNGGESFVVGQTYNITWTKNLVDSVKIEYSIDAGSNWNVITEGAPAQRIVEIRNGKSRMGSTELMSSFVWTVPNAPTTQGRIRVSDMNNNSVNDMSDADFTITAAPPGTWASQSSSTASALYSVSVVDAQNAWAVGDAGAVVKTTNGGTTWTTVTPPVSGEPLHNVFALTATNVLVCVNMTAGNDGRIYRTTDGGASWAMVYQNTATGAFIDAVFMTDSNNGTAVGDPVNGQWLLLKTTDGGSSWSANGTLAQNGSEAGWNNSFEWSGSQNGWFGTNNSRVYYTTNGGANWQSGATPAVDSWGISFINAQSGMIGSDTGKTASTTNGGVSWSSTALAGTSSSTFPAGIAVPTPRWWMISGTTVYKTSDQGSGWTVDHSRSAAFNHIAMKVVTSAGVVVGYAVGTSGQVSKYLEYLPATTGTISGAVFEDMNADSIKAGGDPGLSGWKVFISGTANDSTTTNGSGGFSFTNLEAGNYTVIIGLESGYNRSLPLSGSYAITLAAGQTASGKNFGNYRFGSIAGMKYEDTVGDSTNAGDSGIQGWKMYVSGTKSDSAISDAAGAFQFSNLKPGSYTVSEAQSVGWVTTQPASGTYSVTLVSGQTLTNQNFGNFHLGSISGMSWIDIDGNGIKDAGEPAAANWTVNAVGVKPGNSYQRTTDANGSYSFGNLFADSYSVTEVLQADYSISYPVSGMYGLTVQSGNALTGNDFGNFLHDTASFRSFTADSFAFAKDASGKIGKPMKKVANRVSFKFVVVAPNGPFHMLRLDFNMPVSAKIYRSRTHHDSVGAMNGKRFGPVNLAVADGDSVEVEGYGGSGRLVRVKYQWNASPVAIVANNMYKYNKLGLPVPNTANLLMEMYSQNLFGASGIKVGIPLTGILALRYGWAEIGKFGDAMKSFYDAGVWHRNAPHTFDLYGTKIFVGKAKIVSPKKHNNKLFAELAALRINIVASAAHKTPVGFGDLMYDDGSGNRFCGKSIIQIAASADSLITFGTLAPDSLTLQYYNVVRSLNLSFQGAIDTVSFASKIVLTGARRISQVPYLHRNTTGDRTEIAESDTYIPQLPTEFSLSQNYPNPFNPSTTITFSLPEDGTVTLTIYDVLGREVTSLVNREQMDAGEYSVPFVANNLVSGVYFYRLTVDVPTGEFDEETGTGAGVKTFTDVKKLLLMK